MGPFPKRIANILKRLRHNAAMIGATAEGRFAAFECGTSVQFSMQIEAATKTIRQVNYTTNGCGYMIAASEIIGRSATGSSLTALHGSTDLESLVDEYLGCIPPERTHCVRVSAAAFRDALAQYRSQVIEEFSGEKALICTCFGVEEETILRVIEATGAVDASEVAAACNAGSGCGSCRMLIQEMIDRFPHENANGIVL